MICCEQPKIQTELSMVALGSCIVSQLNCPARRGAMQHTVHFTKTVTSWRVPKVVAGLGPWLGACCQRPAVSTRLRKAHCSLGVGIEAYCFVSHQSSPAPPERPVLNDNRFTFRCALPSATALLSSRVAESGTEDSIPHACARQHTPPHPRCCSPLVA